MVDFGFWASWVAGVVLLCMALLGLRAFVPRALKGGSRPSRTLAFAIILGFAGAAANTLYWQVFGQVAIAAKWIDLATLRYVGGYLDILFKGVPALSIFLHLKAVRDDLPESER